MKAAASRWRPALRSFYKRVHPDLLGRLPDEVRAENQRSMQELEGMLAQGHSQKVRLRFHVVSEDRTKVDHVASATIAGSTNEAVWSRQLDAALASLLRDAIDPELLPGHVRAKVVEERIKAQHEEERNKAMNDIAKDWSNYQKEWTDAIYQSKFDPQKLQEELFQAPPSYLWREPVFDERLSTSPSEAISRLLERDRVRCSADVYLDDGFDFALDTLRLVNLESLRVLETVLMGHVVIEIVAADVKTRFKDKAIQLSLKLSPERAAKFVTNVVDNFVMVHEASLNSPAHGWS